MHPWAILQAVCFSQMFQNVVGNIFNLFTFVQPLLQKHLQFGWESFNRDQINIDKTHFMLY